MVYSIIIPAYNESERLPKTLDRVLAHVVEQQWLAEVVVVNDGSHDNTVDVVREYMSKNAIVRLVENPGNRGKGYSVRHGMLEARGDVLLFTDADLSAPIAEAGKLFSAIAQGADIAIGSRWLDSATQTERQPIFRQISGRVFNLLLRVVVGVKQKDTQCGFKAFTHNAAQAIFPRQRIMGWGFDPEILYIARKLDFNVVEVPVAWAHDPRSKISPLRDGTMIVLEAMKIRWNALCGRYRNSSYPGTK